MPMLHDEVKARCQEIFDAVWRGAERQGWRHSKFGDNCVNVDADGRMCGVALAARHLGLSEDDARYFGNASIQWVVGTYLDEGRRVLDRASIEGRVSRNPAFVFTSRLRRAHDDDDDLTWRQNMILFAQQWKLMIPEETEEG